MKINTKAILYSVLIFPGSGFFTLGQKRIGYSFAAITLVFFTAAMIDATHKANSISQSIIQSVTRHGLLDPQLLISKLDTLPGVIREQLLITPGLLPDWLSTLSHYGLLVLWVAGIAGLWLVKTNLPAKHTAPSA